MGPQIDEAPDIEAPDIETTDQASNQEGNDGADQPEEETSAPTGPPEEQR